FSFALLSHVDDHVRDEVRFDLRRIPVCFRQCFVSGEKADPEASPARPSRDHDALEHETVVDVSVWKGTEHEFRAELLDHLCDLAVDRPNPLSANRAGWDLKEL